MNNRSSSFLPRLCLSFSNLCSIFHWVANISKIEVLMQNFISHDLSLKALTEINKNWPKRINKGDCWKAIKKVLRARKSIESLFALLALNNQIQNFTPTPNQDFESRDFSYFETIIFRDQDSRSKLEVQVLKFKCVSRQSRDSRPVSRTPSLPFFT